MKNTIIIYRWNGWVEQTVLNGVDLHMDEQKVRNIERYGSRIFDQSFDTGFDCGRISAYEYLDTDIE